MKNNIQETYSSQKALELNNKSQAQLSFLLEKKNTTSNSNGSKNTIYAYISLIICISIFSYITFNAYRYHKIPDNLDEIPLLRNDISPLKIIPTDIGGEQFSNQDKLIYNNFEDQKIVKYQKKVIKAEQKKEFNNPAVDAASKEILDTESNSENNQTEVVEKLSTKNKNLKQKQTPAKNKTFPSTKKVKPERATSVFDLLD